MADDTAAQAAIPASTPEVQPAVQPAKSLEERVSELEHAVFALAGHQMENGRPVDRLESWWHKFRRKHFPTTAEKLLDDAAQ
ncbi:hypothetical protein, partial [Streptomyces scabiei]|uniref:hypothetical protein n=1 Tax=Streptomyces scabiei TaxID=1930 RepID=UPI0038F61974